MAKPKRDVVKTDITMPREVFEQIEFYLLDPSRGKMRYGAFSNVTTRLWQQLIGEMQKPGVDPVTVLRNYGVERIGE